MSGSFAPPSTNGITGFTTSLNTTSPNNTVNIAQLLANVVSTNGDIVLSPKGTGAILAQLPDGTSTGGNKRGTYSVDLQTIRTANTQVASGNYSALIAGNNNTASGSWSSVSGGFTNTASGSYSFVGGGSNNIASGVKSVVFGDYGHTRGITGKFVFSSGRLIWAGDCQIGYQVLRGNIWSLTPAIISRVLTSDGDDAGTTNQIQLQNNQTIKIKCDILARSTTGLTKNIEATAIFKRGSNAASTTISTPIYTTIYQDSGTENWTMVLSADTTNGAGRITFTIDNVADVCCMAKVETVEIIYT